MQFHVLLLVGVLFSASTYAQSLVSPGENQFNVVFDFAGVAPGCCPGPLPTCGDGHCNRTETCETCPKDCPCALCGDTICDSRQGENCNTCEKDCGKCPVNPCGDGKCDSPLNENCAGCPQDCGTCVVCGDGNCEFTEDCDTCTQDCGKCAIGYLQGTVRDLITLEPVANATISTIGHKGNVVWTKTNDEGIFYFLRLPPGVLQISTTHPNYGGPQRDETTVFPDKFSDLQIFLGPTLGPEEYWFVMRWETIPDLDLYLFGNFAGNYTSGIVNFEFLNKNESLPHGILNEDIRWTPQVSFPEILKINSVTKHKQNAEIWVHNWSGDRRNSSYVLQDSKARVFVVAANKGIVQRADIDPAIDAETNKAAANNIWWHVYDVTPQNTLVTVNTFSNTRGAMCHHTYCLPNGYIPRDLAKPSDLFNGK